MSGTDNVNMLRRLERSATSALKRVKVVRKTFSRGQSRRDQWISIQAEKLSPGTRVLDVGAGTCPYRSLFNHCEYSTHDFQQLPGHQLLERSGYGHIDFVSDITSIPVPDGSFDVILCTEVLEHIPTPIEAVHEFGRILNRGGILILTAPLGSGLHQEPYHFYGGYTPYWYRQYLTEAGFKDISVIPNGGLFGHYFELGIKFSKSLAPWRGVKQLIWLPVWLLSLPWHLLILPLGSIRPRPSGSTEGIYYRISCHGRPKYCTGVDCKLMLCT